MAQAYTRTETVQAAQITGTLTDFPALFSRTHNDFRTIGNGGHVANANGYDLLLYSDALLTSPLKMETELYVAATGQIIKWAKVASIAVATVVYWGYGDAAIVTSQDDAANVWTNYVGVWHLRDDPTLDLTDSTGNGYTLTNNNTVTATTGQVDGAGNFVSTSSQSLTVSGPATALDGTAHASLSFWSSRASTKLSVVGFGNTFEARFNVLVFTDDKVYHQVENTGVGSSFPNYSGATGTHAIALAYDGTQTGLNRVQAYFDGVLKTLTAGGSDPPATLNSAAKLGAFDIGSEPLNTRFATGFIDEVRLSSVTRTGAWALADYNNQSAPTAFWGLGSESPLAGSGGGPVGGYPAWQASGIAA